jgi:hypothetical protein
MAPHVPFVSAPLWSEPVLNSTAAYNSTPSSLKASSGSIKLWAVNNIPGGPAAEMAVNYFDDTLALMGPTLIGPKDGKLVQMNSITGYPHDVNFTWSRPSLATNYQLFIALDDGFQEGIGPPIQVYTDSSGNPVDRTSDPAAYIETGSTFMPGTTYYWRVKASHPVASAFSETRSFTIEPGIATVPTIGSPANGSQTADVNPAFSWSPVSGTTKYEFQLAVSTNFRTPLYSDTIAETGIRPAVKLDEGTTYFWRVRSIEPVMGDWSTIANFTVATKAEPPPPPVVVETTPPPVIEIPAPEPAPIIEIPAPPPATEPINEAYMLVIIIIGAVLVIAVIVLIVRTRRSV